MRTRSILATVALGVGLVGVAAPASQAAFTTRCVGEGGAVTIPGDLVVPAGRSCVLDGTVIKGNVRVQADADLIITNGRVDGSVTVNNNAYFDAATTKVGGAVNARESFGNLLDDTGIAGSLTTTNTTDDVGFVIATDTTVGERVRAVGGSLDLTSSTVGAQVQGIGAEYTDLVDTVVEGALRVDDNTLGSVVCDSEVYGRASLSGNSTGVQLGGTQADGGLRDCTSANYFGGNVTVNDTEGGVWAVDNIIRGNLAGTGNDPAPVGEGNRVRGELRGQFADLQAPGAAAQRSTMRSQAATAQRADEQQGAAKERKQQATAKADKAGKANL